ncbi:MAG: hypothetical protein AAF252_03840 [Pseudomonadota bacterium]
MGKFQRVGKAVMRRDNNRKMIADMDVSPTNNAAALMAHWEQRVRMFELA